MRILLYNTRFFPDPKAGGQSVLIRDLIKAFTKRGLDVELLTYWQGREKEYYIGSAKIVRIFPLYNIKILDYSLKPFSELTAMLKIRREIKNFDIFHVHGPTYGFYFPPRYHLFNFIGWTKFRGKIPIVYHFNGSLEPGNVKHFKRYKVFERTVLREAKYADIILTLNRKTENVFRKVFPNKDIRIIYNFVSNIFLKNYKEMDNYPEKFTVLYIGGKLEYKGYYDVLKIKKKLEKTDINFKMIGVGIKKYPHEQMPYIYMSSSILLAPSYREGLPPSVMEALALKRPVVASNVGGIPELIDDGVNGFLVEPGNIDKFVEKILYLKENPGLLKKMGENARRKILENFTEEKVVNRILKVYKELI